LIKTELGDSLLHLGGGSSGNSRLMGRPHATASPQHPNENGTVKTA